MRNNLLLKQVKDIISNATLDIVHVALSRGQFCLVYKGEPTTEILILLDDFHPMIVGLISSEDVMLHGHEVMAQKIIDNSIETLKLKESSS